MIDIGVLRGGIPALDGVYLTGDYCSGRIWGIAPEGEGWRMGEVVATGLRITGSGRGPEGELYVTSCECHYGAEADPESGAVWRLVRAESVSEDQVTPATMQTQPAEHDHEHGGGEEGDQMQ